MPDDDDLRFVEATVAGVVAIPPRYVVLLGDGERQLEIVVGPCEARAIHQRSREQFSSTRPLTCDLALNTWRQLGASLVELRVDDLFGEVYYAKLVLEQRDELVLVDCRPSDGLALALAAKVPIYVAERVFEEADRHSGAGPDEA